MTVVEMTLETLYGTWTPEGRRVRVLTRQDSFFRVQTTDGEIFWTTIGEIDFTVTKHKRGPKRSPIPMLKRPRLREIV